MADRYPTLIQSLEKLPVALMVFRSVRDDEGCIVDFEWLYVNPSAEEMVGRNDDRLRGRRLLAEMPGNREAGLFDRYVRVVETGESDSHEFRYAYEDLDIWFSTWVARVGDGFVVTFTEVTETRSLRLEHAHQASILRGMYEQAPFAACVAGGTPFRLEFTNEAFEDLVGRSYLVGTRVEQTLSDTSIGVQLKQILQHVRATAMPYAAGEYQLCTAPDGSPRFFRILARPLDSTEGGTPSVQLVAVDVSELVSSRLRAEELAWQLAEEEELYRATFTDAPVGIAHVELDGRFLKVNERLVSLFGYSKEELFGMEFSDLADSGKRENWLGLLSGETNRLRLNRKYRRKNGTTLWATLTVSLLRDRQGNPKHFVAIVEDVSSLMDAKRRLEESSRHKDEFLAVLGHELRNPLAALRSSSALFSQIDVRDEKLLKIRDTLERQTKQMSRLIDDLLDVGRISRGKLTLSRQRVDLRATVQEALSDLLNVRPPSQELIRDMGEEPMWVEGDPARLLQVCQNLLTNACKYTPERGTIRVSLREVEGKAMLRVSDDGVGLDAAFLQRMFRPFEQEPQDLARAQGGLGLGLALSSQIIRLHGGTIRAESDGRGKGSEFIVELPLLHVEQSRSFYRERVISPPSCYRFLIVEDNQDAAELLGMLLEADGHVVSYCDCGSNAPDAIAREQPQIVLCDIGLPGLSGYEVAQRVRRSEGGRGRHTVLIALSGYGRSEDKQKARMAGFDGHLTKPVELTSIYSVIRPLVGRRTLIPA